MIDVPQLKTKVDETFRHFGVNKRQQVLRLVYEIAKRESCSVDHVLEQVMQEKDFSSLKAYLLARRFPNLSERERLRVTLPELSIDPELTVDTRKPLDMKPKHFMVEESVRATPLVKRLIHSFPQEKFEYIERYRDYRKNRPFGIREYNERLNTFFIVREYYDLVQRCPCSTKSVACQLHITHLGSGCAYECSYCYLPDYINYPGIVIPANIEDFFDAFLKYGKDIRVGSGELTDSLVFDHITGFSIPIVEFFRKYPRSIFEFKTKSVNVDNLLSIPGSKNITIAWSMNPQVIIDSTEFHTASLTERISAARRCTEHGYSVAFHFDPLIYFPNWEQEYHDAVRTIFSAIPSESIETVSLGTLRMSPKHKKIIENRFSQNTILDEEFIVGHDGKLRYPFAVRTQMYKKMKEWIATYGDGIPIYLCMEEKDACVSCESAPMKQYS